MPIEESHPGSKRSNDVSFIDTLLVQPHANMGSGLTKYDVGTLPGST